ncbi:hypothetical protein FK514_29320, partial [Klebsiella pneumoniae]|nr:hypothetical protein [Klebsiella pneumoniae]
MFFHKLFPRSLRQLVTLSFVLILLPLLVLAWQAWQSLNALSAQAAHINRTTLVDARRSETADNWLRRHDMGLRIRGDQ